jgi:hypothetical protein
MMAIPGRLTPGKVRIRSWAAATQAPVLPALMATSGDHLAHDGDRAIGLVANRLDRRFIHLDHLGGHDRLVEMLFVYRQTAGLQPIRDDFFITDEVDRIVAREQSSGLPTSLENGRRRPVATHHIHRSSHRCPPCFLPQ